MIRRNTVLFILTILSIILLIVSCDIFELLNDPADPNSPNYQGYIVVDSLDKVIPMAPKSALSFPPKLYSAKLLGASEYRFQIAPDASFDFIELDKTQSTNIFIPSAWIPSKADSTYYFRVIARKGGIWGEWSDGMMFTLTTVPTTTSTTITTTTIQTPEMIEVSGGTFNNGTANITVSSFHISSTEITQSMYQGITGSNPSIFTGNLSHPVENITWFDAVEYCNLLSAYYGLSPAYTITNRTPSTGYPITKATVTVDMTKEGFRIPTDAEWEFAARGGTQSQGYTYAGSNLLNSVAWYSGNSGRSTHPVKSKAANELGLYDMSGNLWEYCWDWFKDKPDSSGIDPLGPSSGTQRVVRGGAWSHDAFCSDIGRRTHENPTDPYYKDGISGFRVVRRQILSKASPPIFSLQAGTYTSEKNVSITSDTPGVTIRYTTDGTTPSTNSGTIYSIPVAISQTSTLKAIAYKSGWQPSTVSTVGYVITGTVATPVISPAGGTYTSAQPVSITCTMEGALIRYTVNGDTPSMTVGTLYTGSFTISSSTTIKAVAYKADWLDSGIASESFTITGTVSSISRDGLIGEWLFSGNADDSSGNLNNGVIIGATPTSDRFNIQNNAYYFDGYADMIDLPSFLNIGMENFTLCLWLKFNDISREQITFFNTNPHHYLCIGYWNNSIINGKLLFLLSTTGTSWETNLLTANNKSIIPNEWYFFTLIKNSNLYSIKLDNSEIVRYEALEKFKNFEKTIPLRIGANTISTPEYESFLGSIDDVRIFNRVLDDSELVNLFSEGHYSK